MANELTEKSGAMLLEVKISRYILLKIEVNIVEMRIVF